MTQGRDVERLLDRWFIDGPIIVSDRVIDRVADRIEHQSQRHAWRLAWDRFDLRSIATIGAFIVTIAIASSLGAILLLRGGVGGPAATPTPSPSPDSSGPKPAVRIGSDDAYELRLVAEMYAQALERAGYPVTRHLGLGSRQDRVSAFTAGQVDLAPAFVGTELAMYDASKVANDPSLNGHELQNQYDLRANLAFVLSGSPGEDPDEAVVRSDTATNLKLANMSDLAPVQDQLKWGLPSDCAMNPLCKGALEAYGISYPPKQVQTLASCDSPLAQALHATLIDVAWMCSTQQAIAQFGFVPLVDDKRTQPPANIAPILRSDYLARYPTLVDRNAFLFIIDSVSATLTSEGLHTLGIGIDGANADVSAVAASWLTEHGLPR
jgi:osmoprotectant transport system substrate-binding protein